MWSDIHPNWRLLGAGLVSLAVWYVYGSNRFSLWLGVATLLVSLTLNLSRRSGLALAGKTGDQMPSGFPMVVASGAVWLALGASILDMTRLLVIVAVIAFPLGWLLSAREHSRGMDRRSAVAWGSFFGVWAAGGLVLFANCALDRGVVRSYETELRRCEASRNPGRGTRRFTYRVELEEHPRGGAGSLSVDEYLCGLAGRGLSLHITVRPGLLGVAWFDKGALEVVGVPPGVSARARRSRY